MSNYTPGPWKVSDDPQSYKAIVVARWGDAVKPGESGTFGDYRGAHIADLNYVGDDAVPTRTQALANAHLIAAAPQLFEALEDLLMVMADIAPLHRCECKGGECEVHGTVRQGFEALAAARGEVQ